MNSNAAVAAIALSICILGWLGHGKAGVPATETIIHVHTRLTNINRGRASLSIAVAAIASRLLA